MNTNTEIVRSDSYILFLIKFFACCPIVGLPYLLPYVLTYIARLFTFS